MQKKATTWREYQDEIPRDTNSEARDYSENCQNFVEKYGDLSVVPTRYFLGRPDMGEEMHISIEQGKTLIIRLMAVGPVVEGRAQRDVWFEVNGEVSPSAYSRGRTTLPDNL